MSLYVGTAYRVVDTETPLDARIRSTFDDTAGFFVSIAADGRIEAMWDDNPGVVETVPAGSAVEDGDV